jgi:hypothetical protein
MELKLGTVVKHKASGQRMVVKGDNTHQGLGYLMSYKNELTGEYERGSFHSHEVEVVEEVEKTDNTYADDFIAMIKDSIDRSEKLKVR